MYRIYNLDENTVFSFIYGLHEMLVYFEKYLMHQINEICTEIEQV
jgi:hypothetical protein